MRVTDRVRERWRRKRQELGLIDVEAEDFGAAGLARHVEQCAARLLVLPANPDRSEISYSDDFWQWWQSEHPDPVTGSPAHWGSVTRPCSYAALRVEERSTMEWRRCVALHRSGAFEALLGTDVAFDVENPPRRMFRLITLVGRVWAALSLYGSAIERHHIEGPWEIGLALLRTQGAILCCFGRGWREPTDIFGPFGHCFERNVWISREMTAWPAPDGMKALAFDLGGRVEDAWGMRERRFLVHSGEGAGEFDASRYRQHY